MEQVEPYNEALLNACTYKTTDAFNYCGKTYAVKILKVYDGDTVTVAFSPFQNRYYKYQVRVLGYDSPEMKSKNEIEKRWAKNLQKYLNALIGNTICIMKCEKMDKYGRILGSLRTSDGKNITEVLLATGVCKPYGVDGGGLTKDAWSEKDFCRDTLGNDFLQFCINEKLV